MEENAPRPGIFSWVALKVGNTCYRARYSPGVGKGGVIKALVEMTLGKTQWRLLGRSMDRQAVTVIFRKVSHE